MREIDDGLDSKADNSFPKTTSKVKLNINVTLEKSIEECLENYFSEIVSTVYEYEAEFEEDQTLDYLLMKRFLNTAYNNLKDLDSSFMDDYLLELKDDLKVLEGVYARFHKKHAVALVAYESIFLEQQSSYVRFKKRLDYNTSTINTLKSTMKSLENQIKDCQREIRLTKIASVKDEKEADLKRYKTYYVDAIHKNATLRDENIAIKKALEEFAKKYESEFLEQYMTYAKEYDRYIKEQLDGYAYEFDKVMWERAESSSAIRSFFIRANIEDDYSSKTFLKYFIRTLDDTKFSSEHKRLYELLEYLENRAKMRILVVSEDNPKSQHLKHLIRKLDKEYSVDRSDKPRSTYYRKDLKRLDIIFVDVAIQNPNIDEFIDMMQKRLYQSKSKATFCIMANSFTKESLANLKEKGITHLLVTNIPDKELLEHLRDIINMVNE